MKTAALAFALLLGGAASAQTDTAAGTAYQGDGVATAPYETEGSATATATADQGMTMASNDTVTTAAAQRVEPSNSNPERDARGIPVISAAAVVPAGWNGIAAGAAMGGPELDPATGEPAAAQSYPACTRAVTDHCLQAYERGRHAH